MGPAGWLAGLGGVAALVSALFAVWAKVSASRTSNVQQVFEAQFRHMETLAQENRGYRKQVRDMRRDVESQGREIAVLHEDRAKCERDKQEMSRQLAGLRIELEQVKERLPDG